MAENELKMNAMTQLKSVLGEQTTPASDYAPVEPVETIQRTNDVMSSPPTQDAVYEKICCSFMEANVRRGRFYKIKIPSQLVAGDKFVAKNGINFTIKCTVPPKDVLRETSFFGKCERGGGIDEFVLHWKQPEYDFKTKSFDHTNELFVQGSRIQKDSMLNMFRYFMPPFMMMYYVLWYCGGGGGTCEEMRDMEWCEKIDDADIGSMVVVHVREWERQNCSGSADAGVGVPM